MAKLNFNNYKDISMLIPEGEEPITVPVAKAYSWSKIVTTQSFLDTTCNTIRKWYWSRKNLEGIIDGYPTLWKHIMDAVGEAFLLDFVNLGMYSYKKEDMVPFFDPDYGVMFERAFDNIKAVYGGLSIEQIENQAYRALRKEARGRVRGIGFGLSSGIKAAIGAELGNAATGLAHGVFNAIGNSIDSAKANSKMNNFYNQESTLEDIIEVWCVIFWRMYNDHVVVLNNNAVEENSPKIYNYSEMMRFKDSAETVFTNMQKAMNLSIWDKFVAVFECVDDFPFETEYWKIFLLCIILIHKGSREVISVISGFAKEMNDYVPSFSREMDSIVLESMINVYVNQRIEDSEFNGEEIVEQLKDKSGDETFENDFLMALAWFFLNDGNDLREIDALKELLTKINKDIKQLHDDNLLQAYEIRMSSLAAKYFSQKADIFMQALSSGEMGKIVDEIQKTPAIEPSTILIMFIKMCYLAIAADENKTFEPKLIDNIEKLKEALNIQIDLNDLETFRMVKRRALPLEQKVKQFWSFLIGIIRENGAEIMGKHAYWGKIPPETVSNMRNYLAIPATEYFLVAFDDTVFNSGKSGLVITAGGIYANLNGQKHLTWGEITAPGNKLTTYDDSFYIEFKEKVHGSIIFGIEFGGLAANIDFSVLSNILAGACLIFSGCKLEIMNFVPIKGAEFDIHKLEEMEADNTGSSLTQNEPEPPKANETKEPITADQNEPMPTAKPVKSEERFNYLREDDRIYIARKFKERKGFFRHILPASWILTIGFYGLVALLIMMAAYIAIPQNSETSRLIVALITVLVIPIALWVFGIKKRVKYIKEKKKWKECTDSGKRDIKDVYKEFQEMENEYIGL
jgi:hypothetical protein